MLRSAAGPACTVSHAASTAIAAGALGTACAYLHHGRPVRDAEEGALQNDAKEQLFKNGHGEKRLGRRVQKGPRQPKLGGRRRRRFGCGMRRALGCGSRCVRWKGVVPRTVHKRRQRNHPQRTTNSGGNLPRSEALDVDRVEQAEALLVAGQVRQLAEERSGHEERGHHHGTLHEPVYHLDRCPESAIDECLVRFRDGEETRRAHLNCVLHERE